jgi:hypothetical protein
MPQESSLAWWQPGYLVLRPVALRRTLTSALPLTPFGSGHGLHRQQANPALGSVDGLHAEPGRVFGPVYRLTKIARVTGTL